MREGGGSLSSYRPTPAVTRGLGFCSLIQQATSKGSEDLWIDSDPNPIRMHGDMSLLQHPVLYLLFYVRLGIFH